MKDGYSEKLEELMDKVPQDIQDFIYLSRISTNKENVSLNMEYKQSIDLIHKNIAQILEGQRAHNSSDDIRFAEIIAILKDRKSQREEEHRQLLEERAVFHRELKEVVAEQVQKTVNGKVDKILAMFTRIEPVVKSFEDNQAFKRTGTKILKSAGLVAGSIGSWYVIKTFIINILK